MHGVQAKLQAGILLTLLTLPFISLHSLQSTEYYFSITIKGLVPRTCVVGLRRGSQMRVIYALLIALAGNRVLLL
jgi:hypothetical protein